MQHAVADIFRTLADPTRRGLFEQLARNGEQSVGTLTGYANVSQPAVSQHLAVLKKAGLVAERRLGRTIHYRAEPNALGPLVDWIGLYAQFWTGRFEKLQQLLSEME